MTDPTDIRRRLNEKLGSLLRINRAARPYVRTKTDRAYSIGVATGIRMALDAIQALPDDAPTPASDMLARNIAHVDEQIAQGVVRPHVDVPTVTERRGGIPGDIYGFDPQDGS